MDRNRLKLNFVLQLAISQINDHWLEFHVLTGTLPTAIECSRNDWFAIYDLYLKHLSPVTFTKGSEISG